ncbi:hypothetical protein Ahy_B08g090982 [Arachis hypogaea]|uniref:CCHC-type domain-containing protein n=1 Tax=Arachis hypogaea TaxID=3818 RepID=A0A444Y141_ARAHY|nr:hypothetical protein Ahy_B08g090982 [Arachis hypogaea]
MTVTEYTLKFEELCMFLKVCQGSPAAFEKWKCIKFEGGLREELLAHVGPMEIQNFVELFNKSQLTEECVKKLVATQTNHKNLLTRDFNRNLAPQGRNFKVTRQPDLGKQLQPTQPKLACTVCGKNHRGKPYLLKSGIFYNCGKPRHIAKKCIRRKPKFGSSGQQQPGRVFVLDAGNTTETDPHTRGSYIYSIDNELELEHIAQNFSFNTSKRQTFFRFNYSME